MALSTRVPFPDQENIGEGKGKSQKSGKNDGRQTDRIVLHPLQPNSSRSTGKILPSSSTRQEEMLTSKNKSARVKSKSSTAGGKSHMKSKGVQTEINGSVDYEMCTSDEPPLEYWKVLAEQRRQALAETLQENEELHTENESLREKIMELERRLENEDYFAMMYKIACNDTTKDS